MCLTQEMIFPLWQPSCRLIFIFKISVLSIILIPHLLSFLTLSDQLPHSFILPRVLHPCLIHCSSPCVELPVQTANACANHTLCNQLCDHVLMCADAATPTASSPSFRKRRAANRTNLIRTRIHGRLFPLNLSLEICALIFCDYLPISRNQFRYSFPLHSQWTNIRACVRLFLFSYFSTG